MDFDWKTLHHLERLYGETFYLFTPETLKQNYLEMCAAFRQHYSNTKVAFSYTSNPIPDVCKVIDDNGGLAEVSSYLEYDLARRIGVSASKILFNGPYKGHMPLERALTEGAVVIIDSYNEAMEIMALAEKFPNKMFHVGIRVNLIQQNQKSSRFGLDIDSSDFRRIWNRLRITKNLTVEGLQCHTQLEQKNVRTYTELVQAMILATWQLFPETPPTFIDIGGGFYSRMPEALRSQYSQPIPTIEECGEVIGLLMEKAFEGKKKPILVLEPGMALVADTFQYVCRVVDVKEIHDRKIAITSGSNSNFRDQISNRNLPLTIVKTPDKESPGISGIIDFVSYSCFEKDILHCQYNGQIRIGDYLIFSNVGAYSVFRKSCFSLPSPPILEIDEEHNEIMLLAPGEDPQMRYSRFDFE